MKQITNLFKKIINKIKSLFAPTLAKRNNNPYATHLPILIGIAKLIKVKRVLELGSGHNSTPIFLDNKFFPDLEKLISLEDNPEWAKRIRERIKPDKRFQLFELDSQISSVIGEFDLEGIDLIFIDNSSSEDERAKTISQIALRKPMNSIVVIHDYEKVSYQITTKLFSKKYTFYSYNPVTGVVWNGRRLSVLSLWFLDNKLKRNANNISPDDVNRWNSTIKRIWHL